MLICGLKRVFYETLSFAYCVLCFSIIVLLCFTFLVMIDPYLGSGEEIKQEAIKNAQENGGKINVIPVIEKMKAEIINDWKNEKPKQSKLMDFLVGEF